MRYTFAFVALLMLGLVAHAVIGMEKQVRHELFKTSKPFLMAVLFSLFAVMATALIAYFGGHLRVL